MSRRVSKEEYLNRVEKAHSNCYSLISEFVDMSTKITMRHKCGHEMTTTPSVFLKDKEYCRKCSNEKLSKKNSLSITDIKNITESFGYILLSDSYANNREMLNFKCNEGHEFPMIWNAFQRGKRCPTCKGIKASERQRLPLKDVHRIISEANFTVIKFPNGYENRNSQVTLECENGHTSTKSVASIVSGNSCPHCNNQSKSEVKIREYLVSKNIKFTQQFKYDDCVNIRQLPFDFAILDESNNVKFLIEYDGEQHFKPIIKFGGEEGFKQTTHNDGIKNVFCKDNNIKLFRITYKDKKRIEKVLDDIFKNVS